MSLTEYAADSGAAIDKTAASPRLVKLQINTSGAWRNVLDFDASIEGDILTLAERLFSHEANLARGTLRVIMPGDTAPLMHWSHAQGWKKWGRA